MPGVVRAHREPGGNVVFDGRGGADGLCLDALLRASWQGRDEARSRGLLEPDRVRAWLCDASGCTNGRASTGYVFASTFSESVGGAAFTTDGAGLGPNDASPWSGADYFGTSEDYWTGRAPGGQNDVWSDTPELHCDSWSTTQASAGGATRGVPNQADDRRWSNGSRGCNAGGVELVCLVHPAPVPETICGDGADGDLDGATDCDDADCVGVSPCP
jgi:hypothetical protein